MSTKRDRRAKSTKPFGLRPCGNAHHDPDHRPCSFRTSVGDRINEHRQDPKSVHGHYCNHDGITVKHEWCRGRDRYLTIDDIRERRAIELGARLDVPITPIRSGLDGVFHDPDAED